MEEKRLAKDEAQRRNAPAKTPSKGKQGKGGDEKGKPEYDYYIKILLLGDSGMGKTSLLNRFCENDFSANMLSTAG